MPDSHRSHQMRVGRFSETGRIYLLTSVVHNRLSIFADWRLGRLVVSEIRDAQDQGWADSLAWVVMPDHFHWLIELKSGTLPDLMRGTKSRSARAVNAALSRSDCLWQKGYYDQAVRREEDLKRFARYIVANPVRAGLVERIGDYPLWDAVWL